MLDHHPLKVATKIYFDHILYILSISPRSRRPRSSCHRPLRTKEAPSSNCSPPSSGDASEYPVHTQSVDLFRDPPVNRMRRRQSSSVHVWARVPIPAACILLDAVQFKTASGHFARVREFTRAARTCTMGRGSLTNSSSRGISLPMKFSSHSTLLIFPGDDLIEPPSSLIRKLNREKHLSRVLFYGIYLVMGMTTG